MSEHSGKKLKLTAIQRAMAEAEGFASRGDFDVVPPYDAALQGMAKEFKSLSKRARRFYLITTIGAFFLLSQAPAATSIPIFGVEMPVSILSKQALSILLAGTFAFYASNIISASMVYGTMVAVIKRVAPESWDFLLSRWDADLLWANLLRPKMLGAPTPLPERVMARFVQFANAAVALSHIALVVGAVASALWSAYSAYSVFGMALSGLALLAVTAAAVGGVGSLFIKFTYTLP